MIGRNGWWGASFRRAPPGSFSTQTIHSAAQTEHCAAQSYTLALNKDTQPTTGYSLLSHTNQNSNPRSTQQSSRYAAVFVASQHSSPFSAPLFPLNTQSRPSIQQAAAHTSPPAFTAGPAGTHCIDGDRRSEEPCLMAMIRWHQAQRATTLWRPPALAAYMLRSARLRNRAASSPAPCRATPMEKEGVML